jgi:hypothetical protein
LRHARIDGKGAAVGVAKPAAGGSTLLEPSADLYLVGPWATASLDPSLWGFEGAPVTAFVVRDACLRLVRLRAAALCVGYAPRCALAPPLWGAAGAAARAPSPSAVQDIANRQRAQLLRLQSRGAGRSVRPRADRTRPRLTDAELGDLYHAPWMDAAQPRALPVARAAQQRLAATGAAAAAQAAGVGAADDCADALQGSRGDEPAWRGAWRDTWSRALPRALRCFAWMLLHAALPCGGARVVFWPEGKDGFAEAVCCNNAGCRPAAPSAPPPPVGSRRSAAQAGLAPTAAVAPWALETLLHALLECPAVRPALQWLAALWPAASGGGAPPPITAEVWLQASPTAAWQPRAPSFAPRATAELWAAMRLAVLAAAWRLRCRRCALGQQFSAADVVDAALADLGRLVRAEFCATSDVVAVAGTSPAWFPRRRPPAPVEAFRDKWCRGGVLAVLLPGPPPQASLRLDVRLSQHAMPRAARAAGGGAAAAAGTSAGGGTAPAAGGV